MNIYIIVYVKLMLSFISVVGFRLCTLCTFPFHDLQDNLEHVVDYLQPADEREASEEPHGASYSRQLVFKLGCSVLNNICAERKNRNK